MPIGNSQVSCLILAAGQSRRFGSTKLLHPMADGRTLIQHTIAIYQAVFDEVQVVIRPDDPGMHAAVSKTLASVLINPQAEQGMSQSIVTGIGSLDTQDAVLIALGDMPYIDPKTVRKIADQMQLDKIVVPCCDGQSGNPVGFGAKYFDELLMLNGDVGARHLINQHQSNVDYLDVSDAGIFLDIDRPHDLLS